MLSFFQGDVLDEILNLIESVSEGFPSYSCTACSDSSFSITKKNKKIENEAIGYLSQSRNTKSVK